MIQLQNLKKSFGLQELFSDAGFQVGKNERIGVVGRNGSGKSTLFKIILGEEGLDGGNISIPKNYTIGYLSQHLHFTHATVFEEACCALKPNEDGWVESYKVESILSGLGFDKKTVEKKSPAMLSGGFQIRLNLAKALASEPNMLLLDEPTNYLDIVSVRWLQKFLRNWQGELMLITHDRRFMDSVCTHTLGIHRQKMRKMQGNVAKLQDAILADEEVHLRTMENDTAKREHLQKFIERFRYKSSKAKAVQSKVKALERHEPLTNLEKIKTLDFEFTETDFPAKKMLAVRHLSFGFEKNLSLIENLSFELYKGDRLAIVGPNGKGKTTLLNLISGELKPNSGSVDIHNSTVMNYFGQTNVNRLDLGKTVEEEIQSSLEDKARGKARSLAGVMMFEGDNALKKIQVLSGGERSRVLLAKILGKPCNLLLLDEPTNHLDMDSVDSLIEALDEFDGAAILVSHDEEILHAFAKRLIIFDSGKAKFFDGTYQDFLERVGWTAEKSRESFNRANRSSDKRERAEQILQKSRAIRPLEQKIKQIENDIQQKEKFVAECEKNIIIAAENGDGLKIAEISKEMELANEQILDLYAEWEKVQNFLPLTNLMPKILLIFILLAVLAGCAAPKKEPESKSLPESTVASIPENYKDIVFPEFRYVAPYPGDYRTSISDSITLYAVRDTSVPLIDLTFYFKENAIPKNREEVAVLQLLSSLYSKGGTETLSPAQVDDSLEFLSAKIGGSLGSTQSVIHLNCLSRDFDKVLPLLFELFNKPRLDSSRLELQKSAAIQSYLHRYDSPSSQLGALSARVAYKDNPRLWRADSVAIAKVKRKDLLALKDDFFVPQRVIIAAAGDFNTDSLKNTLSKLFASWKKNRKRVGNFSEVEFNGQTGIFASEKDISQANITMAMPFVKRPHPDYYQTAIASYILGGSSFSSRLTNTVRTQNGLAYSIYSFAKSDYEDIALSGITLQTKAESTKTALQLIREEVLKLGKEGPSDEELDFAKKSLIESMPGMFENAETTANTFAISEFNGRSLEHYREYPEKIKAVSKEQVRAMTAKYFNPDSFKVSIVGAMGKMGLDSIITIPISALEF